MAEDYRAEAFRIRLYVWLSAGGPFLNEMRGRYFHIF